jgi:hypothetical protein
MQPPHLAGQKPRGFHGCLITVIEITGNDQRIYLFVDAQIHNRGKGLARGIANQLGKVAVSQSQGAQGRIEMEIGGVNEPERHAAFFKESGCNVKKRMSQVFAGWQYHCPVALLLRRSKTLVSSNQMFRGGVC